VEVDHSFCDECGTALTAATQEATPTRREAVSGAHPPTQPGALTERRVCSVLFCDLVGFTPLSEHKDPEDVRALLSQYFETARSVITRYGGVVEKFIGDAVMAVWGAQVAKEFDTERAVRAGMELVAAVAHMGEQIGAPDLMARAGVVTGEVAVNIGAQGEGMVAGDAVNTAARVQSVAPAGEVFVDEATRYLSERAIQFTAAGDHELKGKGQPVALYRAERVVSGAGGNERADGLEAPLTGRDAELRAVKDHFHSAVERRTPRLVVVSGPAGVGKSRLGRELYKYVDGFAGSTFWLRGHCLSYGEGITFWALSEIIRELFSISAEDNQELASDKLRQGLDDLVPDEQERDYVGVRLARLLGILYAETNTVLSKDELFAGWRLFFERLAQIAPLVLVVEDAQHADWSLLEFFDHLVDWSRDLPIFILIFARPGLEALDAGYGFGRNRSTLSLDLLDDTSMTALVDALVPGMPITPKRAITTHAQGIALYAVETVRSLIDKGIVEQREGVYHLTGDLGTLTVPDSLHALLAARLDALTPVTRSVVADASVLGGSFPSEALIAVSGGEPDKVAEALTELVRRDVLEVSADPLNPERPSYRFSQEMLRQVAYQTLSRKDRKSRHIAVATHLRGTFANDGEEVADAIARHYLDAQAAEPNDADAEELAAEAAKYMVRAAERSERSGAPERAATSYAQAASLTRDDRDAAQLWERAAVQSAFDSSYEDALAQSETAIQLYDRAGDSRSVARAKGAKSGALLGLGRLEEARATESQALEILRPEPDEDTVNALRELARMESYAGNNTQAESLSLEALSLAQSVQISDVNLALVFGARAIVASWSDRKVEAAMYYREAMRLAEKAGDLGAVSSSLGNLADVLAAIDPSQAAGAVAKAAKRARRAGRRGSLAASLGNLALTRLEQGRWRDQAAVLTVPEDTAFDEPAVRYPRGLLAALKGDGKQGRSVRFVSDGKNVHDLLAMLDDLPPGQMPPIVQSMKQLAQAWAASERRDPKAEDAFEDAIASLREAGNAYELGHGLIDYAAYLLSVGQDKRAEGLLAEANGIAITLGSTPLAERAVEVGAQKIT
jgi:class 3 adenylate cyclase/tetratricopeptide (TPR) repeat protein